jgi:Lon protease-like protein
MPNGVARVGCTAEIMEVLERHRDGRLDILTIGRVPFRVVELFTENSLLEGQVDYLEDREIATLGPRRDLLELYETCHTLLFGDYPKDSVSNSQQAFSFLVTGTLPMDLLWKQQVLELRSEADRQERLVKYLRDWAPHLQKAEKARGQAVGNKPSVN